MGGYCDHQDSNNRKSVIGRDRDHLKCTGPVSRGATFPTLRLGAARESRLQKGSICQCPKWEVQASRCSIVGASEHAKSGARPATRSFLFHWQKLPRYKRPDFRLGVRSSSLGRQRRKVASRSNPIAGATASGTAARGNHDHWHKSGPGSTRRGPIPRTVTVTVQVAGSSLSSRLWVMPPGPSGEPAASHARPTWQHCHCGFKLRVGLRPGCHANNPRCNQPSNPQGVGRTPAAPAAAGTNLKYY